MGNFKRQIVLYIGSKRFCDYEGSAGALRRKWLLKGKRGEDHEIVTFNPGIVLSAKASKPFQITAETKFYIVGHHSAGDDYLSDDWGDKVRINELVELIKKSTPDKTKRIHINLVSCNTIRRNLADRNSFAVKLHRALWNEGLNVEVVARSNAVFIDPISGHKGTSSHQLQAEFNRFMEDGKDTCFPFSLIHYIRAYFVGKQMRPVRYQYGSKYKISAPRKERLKQEYYPIIDTAGHRDKQENINKEALKLIRAAYSDYKRRKGGKVSKQRERWYNVIMHSTEQTRYNSFEEFANHVQLILQQAPSQTFTFFSYGKSRSGFYKTMSRAAENVRKKKLKPH